ncbi:hypothetical protein NliqN6_3578 [Naganishia liquefaciens]|uniref:GDP/GTP exchange factor Sec2 N-terminal domain-containing protein n=1 Tax=Naganishia liquefaciens TaxID=104408 RepID=A0A8H3YH02_9TREE|nr:hypothetical protein NliqN6_3578 [Naganishia liquefaciens]
MDNPPGPPAPPAQLTIDTTSTSTSIDAVLAAHAPESPTTMLVDTLRTELSTLTDQAAVLNAKLLASLDRVATLEDAVYQRTAVEREKDAQIVELERAKAQWEESMNTGLLVERTAVKAEMQRLVEGLVEEERRRGSAEEGRARVENEVDDLSATLFEQANTMVAAEKMARTQAETRLRQAEENLAAAEAAMRDMQQHLQSLPTLLPAIDVVGRTAATATTTTTTTTTTSPPPPAEPPRERSYNTSHVPHAEFLAFIAYLRTHRPRRPEHLAFFPPPAIASLLAQPFLARAEREDVDPALRLDAAPDLSWLTRRSVGQAILAGDLIIEPVSVNTLRAGKEYAGVHPADIACSMCGKHVLKPLAATQHESPTPPKLATAGTTRNGSTSRFSFKPFFSSPSATPPSPSASASPAAAGATLTPRPAPTSLFIFRITSPDATQDTTSRMYPLCANGWCLARLRAVCEWWRFVRVCMVDVIWRGGGGGGGRSDDQRQHAHTAAATSKRPSMNDSVSTPMSPTLDQDSRPADHDAVDATATAAPPPDLPARKSAWSLGFKGLGGGRGLGLSKPGSPTAKSPMASPQGERTQEDAGLAVRREEEAGTRSEGEKHVASNSTGEDANDAATTDAGEGGASAPTDAVDPVAPAPTHTADGIAEPPAVTVDAANDDTPAVSSAASETSEPINGFSTPQSTSAPLSPAQPAQEMTDEGKPEEPPAEEPAAEEPAAEEPAAQESAVGEPATGQPAADAPSESSNAEHAIDLSSPRIEATAEPETPSTPAPSAVATTAVPIPTPPRPARRAVPAPPAPPVVPERSRARPTSLTLEPNPDAVATPLAADQVPITPDPAQEQEHEQEQPVVTPVAARLPVLPVRSSAKRGSIVEARGMDAGEVDSWEGKTWREVVRLKEEMWKARVGVTEAET